MDVSSAAVDQIVVFTPTHGLMGAWMRLVAEPQDYRSVRVRNSHGILAFVPGDADVRLATAREKSDFLFGKLGVRP